MVSLSITLLAIIFKISHWPGAGILLSLGLGTTTLMFLPIAFSKAIKSTDDNLLKLLYASAFISFSINFIGMLFKVMHWPGAGLFLLIGIPLPFVFFLPVYMIYHIKRKLKTNLNFFAIVLFMIYLGVFSSLLALRPALNIIDSFIRLNIQLSETNQFLNIAASNSHSEVSVQTFELVEKIGTIKLNLVQMTNPGNNKLIKNGKIVDFEQIVGKDIIVSMIDFENAGLKKFNTDFEEFSKNLLRENSNENYTQLIDEINALRLPEPGNEYPFVANLPLISSLSVLTDWQNKLLLIGYLDKSGSNGELKMKK